MDIISGGVWPYICGVFYIPLTSSWWVAARLRLNRKKKHTQSQDKHRTCPSAGCIASSRLVPAVVVTPIVTPFQVSSAAWRCCWVLDCLFGLFWVYEWSDLVNFLVRLERLFFAIRNFEDGFIISFLFWMCCNTDCFKVIFSTACLLSNKKLFEPYSKSHVFEYCSTFFFTLWNT